MTGPRRSHRKSRKGCAQCKRRRVKCDEQEPRCNNCTKHGIECEFSTRPETPGQNSSSLLHAQDSISSAEPSPGSQSASASVVSPQRDPSHGRSTVDLAPDVLEVSGPCHRDLELMHHWTVETSLTMTNRKDLKRLWQVTIPQEAFSHEFLMRGILAIASLHLSHLRPQQRDSYIFTALSFQNAALKLVQSAMQEITRENCNAVFAFASLVVVFAFASPQFEESLILVEQSEDATAEWVNLIRGVHTILKPSWEWIKNGKLGSLVLDGFESTPATLCNESARRLGEIRRLCEETSDGYEAKMAYIQAMQQLEHCFIDSSPDETGDQQLAVAFVWPAIVPDDYMTMLRRKRPEALIILAHYCIILHLIGGYWWMKGRAYCLVKNIHSMLDDRWREWIRWPVSVVLEGSAL